GHWAAAEDELLREAAARLASEPAMLELLSRDRSRRVRRAVASNAAAGELRRRMVERDAASEVRARALGSVEPSADGGRDMGQRLQTMRDGGILSDDVRKALLGAGPSLDEEGALLAGRYLDPAEVCSLVAQAAAAGEEMLLP